MNAEQARLLESERRERNWKRWGPYLSHRQWGTVREDYSADGQSWTYFTHNDARSRAYRWGEDGLLGICDRECRLAFSLSLWNGKDPILKERPFGLTNVEGNHGEDVKEYYFFLDSTPTHSYMKALYKYPQDEFPYSRLVTENRRRDNSVPEFELIDTGIFEENRYYDVVAEYAKAGANDILIRVTLANRGAESQVLHFLPTVWFRNTWSWGRSGEGYWPKPTIRKDTGQRLLLHHDSLGDFVFEVDRAADVSPVFLFTDNETNARLLFDAPSPGPYVKDAFHEAVIRGKKEAVNPAQTGTKAAAWYQIPIGAGAETVIRMRLSSREEAPSSGAFGDPFNEVFQRRIQEADEFYRDGSARLSEDEKAVQRSAYAGLLWNKQFYCYAADQWLQGDPGQPVPPPDRLLGRNAHWRHLYARDVIAMPDNWEYPWFAAWDTAFHAVAFAKIDPGFAKEQLLLLMREWYMNVSGQIPAYEYGFDRVNPPVHAWACWHVYMHGDPPERRDRSFLVRAFQKLLLNFTWWVNRKDIQQENVFSGGFLGLDNIGVFDRSRPLPGGFYLEESDATAWMAFYCSMMLTIALELSRSDPAYEDIASKFFEHFVAIADAMNTMGGTGLWDDKDGFYYDHVQTDGISFPLRVRSLVGLIPLLGLEILNANDIGKLPGFSKRMDWFLTNRHDLVSHISYMDSCGIAGRPDRLLAIPARERLTRVLQYMLDEKEFLSPFGIRSMSRYYEDHPYTLHLNGEEYTVSYAPAESISSMFGGNSNWRGPVWFPINYLLIEALSRYHGFFGDSFQVECPTGSGRKMNLGQVALELANRLAGLFRRDPQTGHAPWHGGENHRRLWQDPSWRPYTLFHEYFDAETGRGCGASHQTGWTALIARLLEQLSSVR